MARFIGYALCAAEEALKDANWMPTEHDQRERTVIVNIIKWVNLK